MANQVWESSSVNNATSLENAFSVNAVKEEECSDDDFVDDKVQLSETAIITELREKIEQYETSIALDNIKTEPLLPEIQYVGIPDSLKIEEGISADDIKIEFNNELLYCEDCQAYREDYCAECEMLVHILNKIVPINADNKSQKEMPDDILEIHDYFGQFRTFALKVIPAGVKLGPFTGLSTADQPWKIKGGKFVVDKDKSKYLNWMQYINPARNISEQNLQVLQYEHNLYYESTRRIEEGDELLVHFGEEYEDSLNGNVEMDFFPTAVYIFKDAFACTFCCLGFSSKLYLAKHKTICPGNAAREFTIEDLMQCPSCKIHLDQKEYTMHHMAYCCPINGRKYNQTIVPNGREAISRLIYKCQLCKYRTKYKGDLKKHTNLHYEVKMHKCPVCCRRFKVKEALRLHFENTHIRTGEKEYWDHFTRDYTKTHRKVDRSCWQDETEQFKCSLCDFRTKYNVCLKRHVAEKHLRKSSYKCDTCDYKTNWENNLKVHTETRHMKEFKYKCDICDYRSSQKFHLKAHVEARHLKEYKFKCDICDYKTNWKSCLKTHIEARHLNEIKYKCDRCEFITNFRSCLSRHIKTKHLQEFKYKCDACDYKANQKQYLQRHIDARHLKEFKYGCTMCEYKATQKQYVQRHIEAIHLKEFKYKCDRCEYKANQKHALQRHIETRHLKEFKYKCDICDYKTNLKSRLKEHVEVIHLKIFKYDCDMCDYKSNRKYYLKSHIETIHLNEYNYKCETCGYKTNDMSNFKRHVKAKHL